jgi:hypothetical protein
MDERPELLSLGSDRSRGWHRWSGSTPAAGTRARLTAMLAVVLVACLAALGWGGTVIGERDHTIASLRRELRTARQQPSLTAGQGSPGYAGSRFLHFPDSGPAQFSMIAVAIRPGAGLPVTTWVSVSGRHASPGQRYALLGGICGGQYVTSTDLAQATASRAGRLMFSAADLDVSPGNSLASAARAGGPLGGIQGPFTGTGARPFRWRPPCGGL